MTVIHFADSEFFGLDEIPQLDIDQRAEIQAEWFSQFLGLLFDFVVYFRDNYWLGHG